ncbi:hypothetical protein J1605_005273 [Eschrichtius robustus]|uniref:Uncharacterized protein n=1 Tax=Eschrichtius robustus TaxID=9764 RepID=A0AB34HBH1_ESCRO|nr:hypothetical protein J1605_005273 [Eschrichtius robustus]
MALPLLKTYRLNTLVNEQQKIYQLKNRQRASLVVQWLRILLPMQGTRVRALVREDPTCCGASLCATTTEPAL